VDRFDHAVIAVRDLDAAMAVYRDLGFTVSAGGRHTGRGTHNAIIRFGLDYLELLAIYDAAEERAHGGELSAFFAQNRGGLVAFAVATSQIDGIAMDWTSSLASAGRPEPMERMRPDGFRLSWRLLIPGGSPWGKPWPFVIQWDTPDAERLAHDAPGIHPNGFTGVAGITVATRSVEDVGSLYTRDLGLPVKSKGDAEVVVDLAGCVTRITNGDAERPVELELKSGAGVRPFAPPAV
jgi:catechol 2,3-dioxygenase-like lactoylglutathione lyase family enzyme